MRPDRVVVASPALDDDLGLAQSVEDLAVEQLIAKAGVEALDVAVLPRAAALDVSGLGTDSRDPFLHGPGEGRPVWTMLRVLYIDRGRIRAHHPSASGPRRTRLLTMRA